jgi:hypothetical protein
VRLVVSLALATIGCNPIFGLDPLTGRTDADLTDAVPTDAVPTDAVPTCGPAIGTNPGGARVMSAVGWTLEPQAAVQLGSNRALAGVARAVDALDGLIIRRTGATTNEAWRIGGTGGELLVSAASDGASMLAVGTSRTGVAGRRARSRALDVPPSQRRAGLVSAPSTPPTTWPRPRSRPRRPAGWWPAACAGRWAHP